MEDSTKPTDWRLFKSVGAVVAIPLFITIFQIVAPDLWPAAAALAVLCVVLALVLPAEGPLRKHRLGRTPAAAFAAGALTLLFVITLALAAHSGSTVASAVLPGLILWGAATLALWPTSNAAANYAPAITALTGVGVVFLLLGFAVLRDGETLGGVAFLLCGVAALLMGIAILRDYDETMVGVAFLLCGVAALLFGIAFLRKGETLGGVSVLLLGVAAPLMGIAFRREGDNLIGIVFMLIGVIALLVGVAVLRDYDETLGGVAFLLIGVAALLLGVAVLRRGETLGGVSVLLIGVAVLLLGSAVLRDGETLGGVAFLLLGVAALLLGVAILPRVRAVAVRLPTTLAKWATTPRSDQRSGKAESVPTGQAVIDQQKPSANPPQGPTRADDQEPKD